VMVGCGVYLPDAPKEARPTPTMTAQELVTLVRAAAALLEQKGEEAFPEFRQKGSKWLHDDIYFWVWSMDGTRILHPQIHTVKPEVEGKDVKDAKDLIGKPYGKMFLKAAASPEGEGWIHCMWPKPFEIFPTWKSCFVKRVTFPSGKQYLVGSGIYNMQVDKTLIEDVVNRAAALVSEQGQDAFPMLRDKKGPFVFMDVYVFVDNTDGVELVNPGHPSIEGRNLMLLADANGKFAAREYIDAAIKNNSAWVEYYWYKPGANEPTLKQTYVRKVRFGEETYVLGAGLYIEDKNKSKEVRKLSWATTNKESLNEDLTRQVIFGEKGTLARLTAKSGALIPQHNHESEEYSWVISGALKYSIDDREVIVNAGDILVIPSNVSHSIIVMEDTEFVTFFAPVRADWLQGKDQYLRR
jgi:quercetin dioxygenase-like cupin family protein